MTRDYDKNAQLREQALLEQASGSSNKVVTQDEIYHQKNEEIVSQLESKTGKIAEQHKKGVLQSHEIHLSDDHQFHLSKAQREAQRQEAQATDQIGRDHELSTNEAGLAKNHEDSVASFSEARAQSLDSLLKITLVTELDLSKSFAQKTAEGLEQSASREISSEHQKSEEISKLHLEADEQFAQRSTQHNSERAQLLGSKNQAALSGRACQAQRDQQIFSEYSENSVEHDRKSALTQAEHAQGHERSQTKRQKDFESTQRTRQFAATSTSLDHHQTRGQHQVDQLQNKIDLQESREKAIVNDNNLLNQSRENNTRPRRVRFTNTIIEDNRNAAASDHDRHLEQAAQLVEKDSRQGKEARDHALKTEQNHKQSTLNMDYLSLLEHRREIRDLEDQNQLRRVNKDLIQISDHESDNTLSQAKAQAYLSAQKDLLSERVSELLEANRGIADQSVELAKAHKLRLNEVEIEHAQERADSALTNESSSQDISARRNKALKSTADTKASLALSQARETSIVELHRKAEYYQDKITHEEAQLNRSRAQRVRREHNQAEITSKAKNIIAAELNTDHQNQLDTHKKAREADLERANQAAAETQVLDTKTGFDYKAADTEFRDLRDKTKSNDKANTLQESALVLDHRRETGVQAEALAYQAASFVQSQDLSDQTRHNLQSSEAEATASRLAYTRNQQKLRDQLALRNYSLDLYTREREAVQSTLLEHATQYAEQAPYEAERNNETRLQTEESLRSQRQYEHDYAKDLNNHGHESKIEAMKEVRDWTSYDLLKRSTEHRQNEIAKSEYYNELYLSKEAQTHQREDRYRPNLIKNQEDLVSYATKLQDHTDILNSEAVSRLGADQDAALKISEHAKVREVREGALNETHKRNTSLLNQTESLKETKRQDLYRKQTQANVSSVASSSADLAQRQTQSQANDLNTYLKTREEAVKSHEKAMNLMIQLRAQATLDRHSEDKKLKTARDTRTDEVNKTNTQISEKKEWGFIHKSWAHLYHNSSFYWENFKDFLYGLGQNILETFDGVTYTVNKSLHQAGHQFKLLKIDASHALNQAVLTPVKHGAEKLGLKVSHTGMNIKTETVNAATSLKDKASDLASYGGEKIHHGYEASSSGLKSALEKTSETITETAATVKINANKASGYLAAEISHPMRQFASATKKAAVKSFTAFVDGSIETAKAAKHAFWSGYNEITTSANQFASKTKKAASETWKNIRAGFAQTRIQVNQAHSEGRVKVVLPVKETGTSITKQAKDGLTFIASRPAAWYAQAKHSVTRGLQSLNAQTYSTRENLQATGQAISREGEYAAKSFGSGFVQGIKSGWNKFKSVLTGAEQALVETGQSTKNAATRGVHAVDEALPSASRLLSQATVTAQTVGEAMAVATKPLAHEAARSLESGKNMIYDQGSMLANSVVKVQRVATNEIAHQASSADQAVRTAGNQFLDHLGNAADTAQNTLQSSGEKISSEFSAGVNTVKSIGMTASHAATNSIVEVISVGSTIGYGAETLAESTVQATAQVSRSARQGLHSGALSVEQGRQNLTQSVSRQLDAVAPEVKYQLNQTELAVRYYSEMGKDKLIDGAIQAYHLVEYPVLVGADLAREAGHQTQVKVKITYHQGADAVNLAGMKLDQVGSQLGEALHQVSAPLLHDTKAGYQHLLHSADKATDQVGSAVSQGSHFIIHQGKRALHVSVEGMADLSDKTKDAITHAGAQALINLEGAGTEVKHILGSGLENITQALSHGGQVVSDESTRVIDQTKHEVDQTLSGTGHHLNEAVESTKHQAKVIGEAVSETGESAIIAGSHLAAQAVRPLLTAKTAVGETLDQSQLYLNEAKNELKETAISAGNTLTEGVTQAGYLAQELKDRTADLVDTKLEQAKHFADAGLNKASYATHTLLCETKSTVQMTTENLSASAQSVGHIASHQAQTALSKAQHTIQRPIHQVMDQVHEQTEQLAYGVNTLKINGSAAVETGYHQIGANIQSGLLFAYNRMVSAAQSLGSTVGSATVSVSNTVDETLDKIDQYVNPNL